LINEWKRILLVVIFSLSLTLVLVLINNYYFYTHVQRSSGRDAIQLKNLLKNEILFCRNNRISGKRYRNHMKELIQVFAQKAYYNDILILKHSTKGLLWEKPHQNWDRVVKSDIVVEIPKLKSDDILNFKYDVKFDSVKYLNSVLRSITFSISDIGDDNFNWKIAWHRSGPALLFLIISMVLTGVFMWLLKKIERLEKEKKNPAAYENPIIGEIIKFLESGKFKNFNSFLKEKNIDINETNKNGDTALMLYADDDKVKMQGVEALIKNGADVNRKNCEGMTALMLYTKKNLSDIVQLLLENGAKEDIDAINKNGLTALALAINNDHKETIEILINNGADPKKQLETSPYYLANSGTRDFLDTFINNNADELVKLLKNILSKERPIKFITHDWEYSDFSLKDEYGNFRGFMEAVKKQWNEKEKELYKLSSKLYHKIEMFIFADKNPSWCSKNGEELAVGWSSLDGLEKWCDEGNSAFKFQLPKTYHIDGKDIKLFGDAIKLFKREVQIRREENDLETFFTKKERELYRECKFRIEKIKLKGKQFYTDTESFINALNIIFSQFKDYKEYTTITAETVEYENELFMDLKITQQNSFSNKSAQQLLKKVESGDFASIKKNLKNLCDWSVESSYEGKRFRVNYLKSKNIQDIEERLEGQAQGFTHIMRFYL